MLTKNINATLIIELKSEFYIEKEANKVTGIDISHVVNPEADHKEALRNARDKLGIAHNNQQDNTELTGATPAEHHEN
ncbi:hypothetical protein [Candidatus Rickettsia kedanie]|uniref:Uncharacterized protein n=1 Tax=Candidatus Rickettsia kedanie TaxID=3115352 RepID=A0ABP9TT53_9RICK